MVYMANYFDFVHEGTGWAKGSYYSPKGGTTYLSVTVVSDSKHKRYTHSARATDVSPIATFVRA
jgi:hypothetical protein